MSKPFSVIYSPAAIEDLSSIYSYIAFHLKAASTALKQIDRIRNTIRELDTFPEKFALVDWEPWKSKGMHKVPIDNFVVYYQVDAKSLTVTVIRIFYGGRDVESIINSESK